MNPEQATDKNRREEEAHVLDGTYDRIKAVEEAHKALLSRKRITMRLQIYLSFLLVFLFAAGIAVALIMTSSQVARKLRFLEIANEFTLEIVQARRFEKNFFLYGTNLQDALDNVDKARETLRRNEAELKKILGETHGIMTTDIEKYQKLLEKLSLIQESDIFTPDQFRLKKQAELGLRRYGAEMVTKAQDLIRRESGGFQDPGPFTSDSHLFSNLPADFSCPERIISGQSDPRKYPAFFKICAAHRVRGLYPCHPGQALPGRIYRYGHCAQSDDPGAGESGSHSRPIAQDAGGGYTHGRSGPRAE